MFNFGGLQSFGSACRTVFETMAGGRGGHDAWGRDDDDRGHKGGRDGDRDDRHDDHKGDHSGHGDQHGHGDDDNHGGHSDGHDGHDGGHGGGHGDGQDCGDGTCNGAANGVDISIPENAHVAIMVIENDPSNDTYDDYLRVYADDVQDPSNLNDYIAAAEEEYAARGNSLDSCKEVMKVVVENDQHQVIKVLYKDTDGTFTDHDPSQGDPSGNGGANDDQTTDHTGDDDADGDRDHGGHDHDEKGHGDSGHGHGGHGDSGHGDQSCGGLFKFGRHDTEDHAARDDHNDDDSGDHGHGHGHHFAFF